MAPGPPTTRPESLRTAFAKSWVPLLATLHGWRENRDGVPEPGHGGPGQPRR